MRALPQLNAQQLSQGRVSASMPGRASECFPLKSFCRPPRHFRSSDLAERSDRTANSRVATTKAKAAVILSERMVRERVKCGLHIEAEQDRETQALSPSLADDVS